MAKSTPCQTVCQIQILILDSSKSWVTAPLIMIFVPPLQLSSNFIDDLIGVCIGQVLLGNYILSGTEP